MDSKAFIQEFNSKLDDLKQTSPNEANSFVFDQFDNLFQAVTQPDSLIHSNFVPREHSSLESVDIADQVNQCESCLIPLVITKNHAYLVCEECGFTVNNPDKYVMPFVKNAVVFGNYNYNRANRFLSCIESCKDMDKDTRKTLHDLFKKAAPVLVRLYAESNKKYINYNFVIANMLKIIGKTEYLPHFQVVKSKKRVEFHQSIWTLLKKEMNWD